MVIVYFRLLDSFHCWFFALLSQNTVCPCQFFIFFLWKGKTECNNIIVTKTDWCNFLSFEIFNPCWSLSGCEVAVTELANIIWSPRVACSTSWKDNSKSSSWELEISNIKSLCTLDPMRCIKVSKSTFTPNIEHAICWKWSRERSCSYFNHTTKWKLFQESGQQTPFWRGSCSKLAFPIWSHGIDFSFRSQHQSVIKSTSGLNNFVRNSCNIVGNNFVICCANTKLTFLAASSHKETTNIINKWRVLWSCAYLLDISSVILVKVNQSWRINNWDIAYSTLTILIETPCINITNSRWNKRMAFATRNWLRFEV